MTSEEARMRELLASPPFSKRDLTSEEAGIFMEALTHDSYVSEKGEGVPYERLEFLGDAVTELVASEYAYRLGGDEGEMTDTKQSLVANRCISAAVLRKGIRIDPAARVGNGHIDKRTKIPVLEENMRADIFEAIVGAFYLMYGLEEARRLVLAVLL
ncbi:MAG: ribonuclease III domain-containing protein [Candidatus Methanomethylophilaceae archaeon]|jgi:ribonuclease-3|nr:ribonuclease III domain-containing protein [Candidatus Methanomethylophilaceae archaeon]MDD3127867.1 ribonuclease III domain-containing protein [Candidatus Methanomethylophilaceae archaeon]MDD4119044.1 ribonuclease III domain-containing protein [Candidatus Methanomethylophilaceae archaeon]MDD4454717.1 ribonuclease III domain-containing protein [Candidatus Methanomethylophilaceae archaeon]MDI9378740.1 ribonuclease III domain-containing protein [Candidatus Thermoplasmatota archaeon]